MPNIFKKILFKWQHISI